MNNFLTCAQGKLMEHPIAYIMIQITKLILISILDLCCSIWHKFHQTFCHDFLKLKKPGSL